MKMRHKRKLHLEYLEDRYALATGAISAGNLTITDTAAANLLIQHTAATEWTVTNNGAPIAGSPFTGVTGNLIVRTGSAADVIDIDLGGLTAPKSVIVRDAGGINSIDIHDGGISAVLDLLTGRGNDELTIDNVDVAGATCLNVGNGANTIDITNSSFAKRGTILTGTGTDDVTLGDGSAPVTFGSTLQILDYGDPDDTLQISDLVSVSGTLLTDNFNTVNIDADAELHSHFYYSGGYNVPNTLTVNGVIDGSAWLYGSGGVDTLTFGSQSNVGGAVQAYLRGGNDVANFDGAIGRSLYVDGSTGDDTVNLAGTVNIAARIFLGNGADKFDFTGTMGVAPSTSSSLVIDAGNGADQVAIRAGSRVNGQLSVNMGAQDDAFFLADLANVTSASINGGTGSDSYYGTRPRANVVDKFFELFGLVPPF